MLSNNSDNVKGEGYTQSFASARGVDKYKGKGLFKVNKGGKYKVDVERVDKFRNIFL